MKAPICEFIDRYANEGATRLHMPGHKGVGDIERYDITEIQGADSLFEADGIIKESEDIAGEIFGAYTFYSTEGSSLSIRAMTYLVSLYARSMGRRPIIAAGRNSHKSFISAAALSDFDVDLLNSATPSYLSCPLTAEDIKKYLSERKEMPTAVYLTSPDYLGYTSDVAGIAEVCHEAGVLLIVDNAHGAYLKFLSPSHHPTDLGADICCDSAHKTLGALTGGAYLHISKNAPAFFRENARAALMLFASTSPSYLILRSLDGLNGYLSGKCAEDLRNFIPRLCSLKAEISSHGYTVIDSEPMKITIYAKDVGYEGTELASLIVAAGIYPEFADPDYLVLMPTQYNSECELRKLKSVLLSIPRRTPIEKKPPLPSSPTRAMSIRDAVFSARETVPTENAAGRILADVTVGCPPAVPIIISGEVIDESAVAAFEYYGIHEVRVVKDI